MFNKFFNWLEEKVFKVGKPVIASHVTWREWETQLRTTRPVAYFFCETLPYSLSRIKDFFINPLNNFRYWFHKRFCSQPHLIKTHLPKGQYLEFNQRLLYGAFSMLVDFVECELADQQVRWASDEDNEIIKCPWHRKFWWARFTQWRCPEAGILHLSWEMNMITEPDNHGRSSERQSQIAREVFELYSWWKHIRPTRPDTFEASGLAKVIADLDKKYGNSWGMFGDNKITAEEDQMYRDASDRQDAMDTQNLEEDDEMLLKLTKMRHKLWS